MGTEVKPRVKNSVIAVVVTFNPPINRLRENVVSIFTQVQRVYLVDNGSSNFNDIEALAKEFPNVAVVSNHSNKGISYAINKAALYCSECGCDYLLTLDQDSVCPPDMVCNLLPLFELGRVGLVCPSYFDRNRASFNPRHCSDKPYVDVDMAITSGSLCLIDAFKDVGGMDESLFVGSVDDDYCLMLRKAGWRIIQNNEILLDHELGVVEKAAHSEWWERLHRRTGIDLFHSMSYVREVSPMRAYHGCRAAVYLKRKHGVDCGPGRSRYLLRSVMSNVVRSDRPLAVLFQSVKGIVDGGKIPVKSDRWR